MNPIRPFRQSSTTLAWSMLRLTIPLVLSTGCFALTLFTDRLLLMYYQPVASAASTAAGTLYWTIACLPVIAIGYASTLVAQQYGRRQRHLIGPTIWQTVWATLAMLPLFAAVAVSAPHIFASFGHTAELAANEAIYFRILLAAAPAAMLEGGLTAFYTGRSRGKQIFWVNLGATLINIPADYLLIFGFGPLPPLGSAGASLATVGCQWLKIALFASSLYLVGRHGRYNLGRWRPDWTLMRVLVARGLPLGSQQLIRSAFMSLFFVLLGAISMQSLSASGIVMSLNQLILIPLIGLSTAATVMIAQWHDRCPQTARRVAMMAIIPAIAATLIAGGVYWSAPAQIGQWLQRSGDSGPELSAAVRFVLFASAPLLVLETLCQLAMAVLRGLTRTGSMLRSTAVATAIIAASAGGVWASGNFTLGWAWGLYLAWVALQAMMLMGECLWIWFGPQLHSPPPAASAPLSQAA